MSFKIKIPLHVHDSLTKVLKTLPHVSLHNGHKGEKDQHGKDKAHTPGEVRTPDGGLLHFSPIANTDEVEVTVKENPQGHTEEQIKAALQEDISKLVPGQIPGGPIISPSQPR